MKYTLVFLLFSVLTFAQNDSINLLDEIQLYGNFSPKINAGFKIVKLTDSVINSNNQSLGNLLQNNANIYFKQNGYGMVSSIALRGSNASQTGVYWNGIAINSTLNGQTDFSTLKANGFDQIEIRKGAGSTLFGSGAIGGAINLSDKVSFQDKNEFRFHAGVGSYNSQDYFYQIRSSTKNLFAKVNFQESKSDNKYPFLNTALFNENGAFKNSHFKGVFGHEIDANNQLKIFTNYSVNHREFSRTLTAPSDAKYKNIESKLMLQYDYFGKQINSSLKLAVINEEYNYFFHKTDRDFSFGKSNNYIGKYDFNYFINNQLSVNYGIENQFTTGNGTNISKKERNVLESYLLIQHQPIKNLNYNVSFRKGFSSVYRIPFIYAIGAKYELSPILSLNGNYSTNYKLPTFNDLYWDFSGNENLKSENSTAYELGIEYHRKTIKLSLTSFLINSSDLIQWRPITSTFWRPINIQEVSSYGLEFGFQTAIKFNEHHIEFQTQYDYTISKDIALEKQLIYIPYHKGNIALNYRFKTWSINYNQHYNGKVFTTTSNTQIVESFWLSNIRFNKTLSSYIDIGFHVNNLFNKEYQTVAYRPMPNRNYKLNINIKF